jgi:hypothetical protein
MASFTRQEKIEISAFYRSVLVTIEGNMRKEQDTLPARVKQEEYTKEFAKNLNATVLSSLPPGARSHSTDENVYITFVDANYTSVGKCGAKFYFDMPSCPGVTDDEIKEMKEHMLNHRRIHDLRAYTFTRISSYNTYLDMLLDLPMVESFCEGGMKFPITSTDKKKPRESLISDELRLIIENQIFKIRIANEEKLPRITGLQPFRWIS